MRLVPLALTCLLALPAIAADRREAIRVRYLSPSEVLAVLAPVPVPGRPARAAGALQHLGVVTNDPHSGGTEAAAGEAGARADAMGGLGPPRDLLPAGLTAIAPDNARRTLTVAGTPQAIEQVKEMVRLLDVAPRPVELRVKVLPLDEADLRRLGLDDTAAVSPLDERKAALVERAAAPLVETRMSCSNNQPLRVFWSSGGPAPAGEGAAREGVTIVPRVNGDRTITLFVVGARGSLVLRRMPSRGTLLALTGTGAALLVRATVGVGGNRR
jgi:hypothetical protein